jgi:hypothetical protein
VDLEEDDFEVVPKSQHSAIPESLQWDGKEAKAPLRKRPESTPEGAPEGATEEHIEAEVVESSRAPRMDAESSKAAQAGEAQLEDAEESKLGATFTEPDTKDEPLLEADGKVDETVEDIKMPTKEEINRYWKAQEMNTFSDPDAGDAEEEEGEEPLEKGAKTLDDKAGERFEQWGVPVDVEAQKQRPDGHLADLIDELLSHYRGSVLTTLHIFENGWDANQPEMIEAALTDLSEAQMFVMEFKKMYQQLNEAVGHANDTKLLFYFTRLLYKKDELADELEIAIQALELDLARSAEKFGYQKQTSAYLDLQDRFLPSVYGRSSLDAYKRAQTYAHTYTLLYHRLM